MNRSSDTVTFSHDLIVFVFREISCMAVHGLTNIRALRDSDIREFRATRAFAVNRKRVTGYDCDANLLCM